MNLNQLFNLIGNTSNNTSKNISENSTTNNSQSLYPNSLNLASEDENLHSEQNFNHQENTANSPNFAALMPLLSLFSSKKQDLPSLLTSSAAKSMGLNENMLPLLSMLGNKKSKTQLHKDKSTLPKIDTLSRVK